MLASGGSTWLLYGYLPPRALTSDRIRVLHDIAAQWRAMPPDVLMVGGSQLRELAPEDAYISTELSASCGRPIRAFTAATSTQPLESSWAIASLLRRPDQLVVINLNLLRVMNPGITERFPRNLLPLSNAEKMPVNLAQFPLSEFAIRENRLGILFVDAINAAGIRGEHFERLGPFESFQHNYRGPPESADMKTLDARSQASRLRPLAETGIEQNARAFATMAIALQSEGAAVVFVLAPSSQQIQVSMREFDNPTNRAVAGLRDAAPLLDLRNTTSLVQPDFADSLHLKASGRMKVWSLLHEFLGAHVPRCAKSRNP